MEETSIFINKIRKDLIFLNMPGDSWKELLENIADCLMAKGVVKESYKQGIIEREKEFATGLPLGEINFALPHTFPEHIVEHAIALIVPRHPVDFVCMGDPDSTVSVSLCVCPLLEKIDENIELLPSLMKFFANQDTILEISRKKTPEEVYDYIVKEEL